MIELRVTHRRHAENDTLNIRQEASYNVIAYLLHSVSQPFDNMQRDGIVAAGAAMAAPLFVPMISYS